MAELSGSEQGALRKAIQSVYGESSDLKIFVAEKLNKNLIDITDDETLKARVFGVIQWAEREGRLEDLLAALEVADETADRSDVKNLCRELRIRLNPLADRDNLPSADLLADLDNLFQHFNEHTDLPYVQIALRSAFQVVFDRSFQLMRPDRPRTDSLAAIQTLLSSYEPELSIRFVERAITEFQRSEKASTEDAADFFRALHGWRQETASKFNVPMPSPVQESPREQQGYLLVALNALFPNVPDLNVSAELVLGEKTVSRGVEHPWATCTVDGVADRLSQWILSAEHALADQCCSRLCIELFVPCHLLETVADEADGWTIHNIQKKSRSFKWRDYVMRSLERVVHSPLQARLTRNWERLEESNRDLTSSKTLHEHFHVQSNHPNVGELEYLEAPGLSVVAELTSNAEERQELLADVVNSGVPIALWFGSKNQQSLEERRASLERMLQEVDVMDYALLSRSWRKMRSEDNVRLLVDCPHRSPSLPDPDTREDDAMVSDDG